MISFCLCLCLSLSLSASSKKLLIYSFFPYSFRYSLPKFLRSQFNPTKNHPIIPISPMSTSRNIKKILVTFDLNKTLLYACKKSQIANGLTDLRLLQNIVPSEQIEGYNVYFRNGRPELLDFLFMENSSLFEVGVWSSLDSDFTGHFAKSFFGRYYRNLAFVAATRREDYEGVLK